MEITKLKRTSAQYLAQSEADRDTRTQSQLALLC